MTTVVAHRYATRGAVSQTRSHKSPALCKITYMRTCSVDGCPRAHYAVGYCNPHWRRWKRNGDPGPAEIKTPAGGTCSFDGCDRPKSCRDLCASHYAQQRRGMTLVPLNDRVPAMARDEQGRKRCATCKQWLDPGQFRADSGNADGLMGACIRCMRHRVIAKRYGITLEHYERLAAAQDDVCAICGGSNESGRSLAVDHDHGCCSGNQACGTCVRGLLCSNCNMALGLFKEDPARLKAAVAYLAMYGART